ncbi:ECF RNA polymerase sigma factor SigK [Agromyces sp. SYSU T00194]|uniref:ECF RNA polymerase sigma factor SigK n=1 Tax=Agromyces chitinivorans TaxID=3158560 RepID=UPI00339AC98F
MLELVRPDTETDAPATTPDALLVRVGTGDQEAFGLLYDRMAPRVLGLVRRLLVDPAQSEEVAQEVFLEVWQQAPRFDPVRGSAVSWMLTLAHRRAVDRIRSAQSAHDRDVAAGHRDLAAPVPDPSESVEVRIEHERVVRAMGGLSGPQRESIELAYYGGLTQREIAERLEVPLGTVKTRIRDGMGRLRDALGVTT